MIAFVAALVATIVGMGPLGFLLALGSMFVFGGFQAGVEALCRGLRNRTRRGPAEKGVDGRALLTSRAPPSGRGGSRWRAALGLWSIFAARLRRKLRKNGF